MKVKELIKTLLDYNMDADVKVLAHSKEWDYTLTYGSSDGVKKHNCDIICFYVDKLNTNETFKLKEDENI